jgi:hypothetical protein
VIAQLDQSLSLVRNGIAFGAVAIIVAAIIISKRRPLAVAAEEITNPNSDMDFVVTHKNEHYS